MAKIIDWENVTYTITFFYKNELTDRMPLARSVSNLKKQCSESEGLLVYALKRISRIF